MRNRQERGNRGPCSPGSPAGPFADGYQRKGCQRPRRCRSRSSAVGPLGERARGRLEPAAGVYGGLLHQQQLELIAELDEPLIEPWVHDNGSARSQERATQSATSWTSSCLPGCGARFAPARRAARMPYRPVAAGGGEPGPVRRDRDCAQPLGCLEVFAVFVTGP